MVFLLAGAGKAAYSAYKKKQDKPGMQQGGQQGYDQYNQGNDQYNQGNQNNYQSNCSNPPPQSHFNQPQYATPPPSNYSSPRPHFAPSQPPQEYRSSSPYAAGGSQPPSYPSSSGPSTVLELFQSQGCSSCPPANDAVLALISNPDILVLTYDVTYWDHLGWKDTFGDKQWDSRQWEYARGLGKGNVYTPQVIVNGMVDGVGNSPRNLQSIVSQGQVPRNIQVSVQYKSVTINGPGRDDVVGVFVIAYDANRQQVVPNSGENKRANLAHQNIVKSVTKIGDYQGGSKTIDIPKAENWGLQQAIIIQERPGGPILGAARVPLQY
ncbi:hypothetical protein MMC25_001839 [Agyrium rufum]|nr:hypothetical protein [Agyrium rufum]